MSRWTERDLCWLGTPSEARLGLAIIGYEFPGHAKPGDLDANWLVVGACVECDLGCWSFTDPCLTTTELTSLIEWLKAFPSPTPISFLEPPLAFACSDDDPRRMTVRLRGEAIRPGLVDEDSRWHDGVDVPLRVTPASVADFVNRLLRRAKTFPAR